MKEKIKFAGMVSILIVASLFYVGLAETAPPTEVTIYNQNFGVVKELREINLDEGLNTVLIQDVAKLIDPTSVSIKDLTGVTQVLEQNYLYDLVNKQKIYEKYIGKEITIIDKNQNTITGVLLSFLGNELIIQNDTGVHVVMAEQVSLPKLPEGLITKPTLKWLLESEKAGTHDIQLSYMTSGLNWVCDYVAVVDEDDSHVDLTCWVTITNNSGATYKNAKLKLIAGEVHKVEEGVPPPVAYEEEAKAGAAQFQEEAFFEYHLYTLQRKTDIMDNQQKQVTLFTADSVAVQKEYVFEESNYYRGSNQGNVKVMLTFENTQDNNMGMPLPKGKVRVYKKDSEGQLQFVGEDLIDHTPKDEKLRIYLGDAFDLVAQKKQTDYNRITDRIVEVSYEVSLRNHKDEPVTIAVVQKVWGEWRIVDTTHDYIKEDAWTCVWYIEVPKDGEVTLTYTVRIQW
ncbi:MAG: DUF4139 domain-containing protein [Candidatus Methanofastidiosia archaeon]|jgi:hypothetical protein